MHLNALRQQLRALPATDAQIATAIFSIIHAEELPEWVAPEHIDPLYRLTWAFHIRALIGQPGALMTNNISLQLAMSEDMTLDEVFAHLAMIEGSRGAWVFPTQDQEELGDTWAHSANASIEVMRWEGASLRLLVDLPLTSLHGDTSRYERWMDEEDGSAMGLMTRGSLHEDFLAPEGVEEAVFRATQLVETYIPVATITAMLEGANPTTPEEQARVAVVHAMALRRDGEGDVALSTLESLDSATLHEEGVLLLSELLSEAERWDDVLALYGARVEQDPEDLRWRAARAEVLLGLGRTQDAIADVNAALATEDGEGDAALYVLRAECHEAAGHLEDAIKDASSALELDEVYVSALGLRGRLHHKQENWEQASEDLGALLVLDQDEEMIRLFIDASFQLSHLAIAHVWLNNLLESHPQDLALRVTRADVREALEENLLEMCDRVELLKLATPGEACIPKTLERLGALGYQGPVEHPWPAPPDLEILMRWNASSDPTHAERVQQASYEAHMLAQAEDFERAAQAAERASELAPELHEVWMMRAQVAMAQGQLEKARPFAERAAKLAPGAVGPMTLRADLAMCQGDLMSAIPVMIQAFEVYPFDADVAFSLGSQHEALGDWEQAQHWYERTIALDPGHKGAYFQLGVVFQQTGRFEEAIQTYNTLLILDGTDPVVYTNLGAVLIHLERVEDAEAAWARAVELDVSYPSAYRMLGISELIREELSSAMVHLTFAALMTPPEDPTQPSLVEMWQGAMSQAKSVNMELLEKLLHPFLEDHEVELVAAVLRELEPVASGQAEFWVVRSQLSLLTADNATVMGELHKALELDPTCISAHLGLFDQMDGEGALEHGVRALELWDDSDVSQGVLADFVRQSIESESMDPEPLLARVEAALK